MRLRACKEKRVFPPNPVGDTAPDAHWTIQGDALDGVSTNSGASIGSLRFPFYGVCRRFTKTRIILPNLLLFRNVLRPNEKDFLLTTALV